MLKPGHFRCLQTIAKQLEKLKFYLQQESRLLMRMADAMTSKQLRQSIQLAAQECAQYAIEIEGQLSSLGYTAMLPDLSDESNTIPDLQEETVMSPEIEEVIHQCKQEELRLMKVYREVLNEPFLMNDLRNLVRRQYNGILCAFLQLKLLDSRYTYYGIETYF